MGSKYFIPEDVIFNWMDNGSVFEKYPLNDIGAAQLTGDIFKFRHRFNSTAKEWFLFNGKFWEIDRSGLAASADLKTVARILNRYSTHLDNDSFCKYAFNWNNSAKRRNILNDSKDVFPFSREDCDRDDYILNLNNGTLFLSNNGGVKFSEHKPEMLLLNIAPVDYIPNATCPRWELFITEIMLQDESKSRYLQKVAGLCLTGNTTFERMWFLFGSTTRNGKSTFIETILWLLGTYATTIRAETLAIKTNPDSRTASPDIAKLAGKRLVVCSEPPKRLLLDEALIKSLTGGDTITARFLNENQFEYIPKFKLICNTNYLPVVSDLTIFQSDRIQVVEFGRHFEPHEQDKTLKQQFKSPEAMSGILNWMIEGWKMFCAEGLDEPTAIKAASIAYQENSDKISNFLKDCTAPASKGCISIKDLYSKYDEWCQDNGFRTENKRNFIDDIKAKGIYKDTGTIDGRTVKRVIKGYTFITDDFVPIEDEPSPFDDTEINEELPFECLADKENPFD